MMSLSSLLISIVTLWQQFIQAAPLRHHSGTGGKTARAFAINGSFEVLLVYRPLLLAIIFGGQIGNLLSFKFFTLKLMVLITGMLVLFLCLCAWSWK